MSSANRASCGLNRWTFKHMLAAGLRFVVCLWLRLTARDAFKPTKYVVAPRLRTRSVQRKILSAVQLRLGKFLTTPNAGEGKY